MSEVETEGYSSDEDRQATSVFATFREWFHVPVLTAIVGVMLWIRLRSYENFFVDGEIYFAGNDSWYHLRQVRYTVRNWPSTMPFDPWTYFPYGTDAGQFGTIYDQIVATAALVVGLGSPSEATVATTLLVAPAVFGSLVAIPTYLIGKRLGGRVAGLFGAAVLMLLPGIFLNRGLVGFADHNIAEPLFMGFAVFGLLVAVAVAEREVVVWELLANRELDAVREPLLWGAAAGVLTGLYLWLWQPGVLLIAIFGVFLVVKSASDFVNGRSAEPVLLVGAVAMTVTGLMMLIPLDALEFSVTDYSLLQPFLAFGVALGAGFLVWLARQWEELDLEEPADRWGYPVAMGVVMLAGMGGLAVVLPDAWGTLSRNALQTVGFSAGATTRTIGEAQPYLDPNNLRRLGFVTQSGNVDRIGRILADYGFTFFTAAAAVVLMLARPLYRKGETLHVGYLVGGLAVVGLVFAVPAVPDAVGSVVGINGQLVGLFVVTAVIVGAIMLGDVDTTHLFVVVWAAFIASAAFTQLRFHYYLAPIVAILNAFVFASVLEVLDLREASDLLSRSIDGAADAVGAVEWYKVLVVIAVVAVVLVPVLGYPISVRNTGNADFDDTATAWQAASNQGPGNIQNWDDSLQWMEANTPAEGEMGGADNRMEYYGSYSRTSDFAYPEGAYGVQSWWDYGHWITLRAERIPNANPFQQGATEAANFLLAPNETAAEEVLAAESTEGDQTRYVMVDAQMATPGSKFGAPVVFYNRENVSQSTFYGPMYASRDQNYGTNFNLRTQRYYESQMIRLYEYHGSARNPAPIVVDWENERVSNSQTGDEFTIRAAPPGNQSAVRQFQNMSAAREYVERDGSSQVGGIGPFPSERVPALEHYRLVDVSNRSALQSGTVGQYINGALRTLGFRPSYPLAQQILFGNEPSWVKTFERVPGATVEGSGAPPNTNVTAIAQFRVPETNETFQYRQRAETDANGDFEMTLPYATTGYDDYGPENGYTNVSVRATADAYTLRTPQSINESGFVVGYGANLTVPEGAVNGADEGTIQVELERRAQSLQVQQNTTVSASGSVSAPSGALDPATDAGTDSETGVDAGPDPSASSPASPVDADLDPATAGGPTSSGDVPAAPTLPAVAAGSAAPATLATDATAAPAITP